jgi:hypothetical protein
MFRFLFIHCYFFCKVEIVVKVVLHVQILHMFISLGHSYDILGVGMLWKPKDLHKIR